MELLWNITGATPEPHRSNALATRQQQAGVRRNVPGRDSDWHICLACQRGHGLKESPCATRR
jgi:hypothetical protein